MKKRELKNILSLIINEQLDVAKENIIRVMNEQTESDKEKAIKDIEDNKNLIDYEQEHPLSEKEEDINNIASTTALDDVQSGDMDLTPELASDVDQNNVDPNDVNYRLNDIKFDIDDLKKKFDMLMDKNDSEKESQPVEEDTLEQDLTSEDTDGNIAENKDMTLENLLSQDLISSLLEEYSGERVKDIKNKDGLSVGDNEIINQNDVSPLTDNNVEELITDATPIEIKNSDSPVGYEREKSPEVKGNGIDPINKIDVHTVPENGDKNALLNSNKGFGGKDSKSPISGK